MGILKKLDKVAQKKIDKIVEKELGPKPAPKPSK